MAEIPIELIANILSRLPLKALFKCKCVSKTWCNLLSESWFVQLRGNKWKNEIRFFHAQEIACSRDGNSLTIQFLSTDTQGRILQQSSKEVAYYEGGLYILCSPCNGLICLYERRAFAFEPRPIYLCNPMTHQFVILPEGSPDTFGCAIGFGYSSSTREYKVVRMFTTSFEDLENGNTDMGCEIFGFKGEINNYSASSHSSSWKVINDSRCPYPIQGNAVFANGCLHWAVNTDCFFAPPDQAIVFFDLASETFGYFPHPLDYEHEQHASIVVLDLGGMLSLIYDPSLESSMVRIWMLEDYEKGIWSTAYHIMLEDVNLFPRFMVDKEIMLAPCDASYAVYYNIDTGSLRTVQSLEPARKNGRKFGYYWESYEELMRNYKVLLR